MNTSNREMKDSGVEWIGEIPTDWNIAPIKRNFKIYAGATPKSENAEYWDGNLPWITPADYKTSDKFVKGGRRNLSEAGYASCGTTLVPCDSVIFSKRAPVGSVAISTCPLCTNQGCLSCVPTGHASSAYFYYVMSVATEHFELVSAGTTFKEISAVTFSNFLLPCPPHTQQQVISCFLDRECAEIDAVLEKTRASIEEYKKLKQAVITQAVTKGIRPNRPMKDSGVKWIGKVPVDWEISRIKYVSIFQPCCDFESLTAESIITYTPMECVKDGTFERRSVLFGAVSSSLTPFQNNDIVMAKVTPCFENGNIAIMQNLESGVGVGSSELFVFRANHIFTPYLFYWLRNTDFIQRACSTMTGTGGLKRVDATFMKDCAIHLPPEIEQQEIADYLDTKCTEIDTLISKKEQLLTELETYKKSLIYEVVTGKREAC